MQRHAEGKHVRADDPGGDLADPLTARVRLGRFRNGRVELPCIGHSSVEFPIEPGFLGNRTVRIQVEHQVASVPYLPLTGRSHLEVDLDGHPIGSLVLTSAARTTHRFPIGAQVVGSLPAPADGLHRLRIRLHRTSTAGTWLHGLRLDR